MGKKQIDPKVKKFIQDFVKELRKQIQVEKVILFGSYARGTPHQDSDVDLVFISPDFAKMDVWKRFEVLGKARKNYQFATDYFGLTPEEYKNASPLTTLGEVKETGKVVYSS